MTNPVRTVRGVKLLLKLGDGADPETFSVFCSVNAQRGISFKAGVNEQDVIDCDNPDAVAWVTREKTNLSSNFDGAGTLDSRDAQRFYEWFIDPDSRNCEIVVDVPGADGGVTWSGAYHLTDFSITGNRGSKAECSISVASDGLIAIGANA